MSLATRSVSVCCTSCANTLSRVGRCISLVSSSGAASATTLPLARHDHALAYLFDYFEHVRDIENRLSLAGQQDKQVLE